MQRHITHPILTAEDNTQYFFAVFQTNQDIEDFCSKCPWFDKDDAHIYDSYIIEVHGDISDPENKNEYYYEIFTSSFVKQKLSDKIGIYQSVLGEVINFFN